MRRYGLIVLFVLVLATPLVLRMAMGRSSPRLGAAGAAQRLVVLTANAEPIRTEFADAFSQWHQEKFGQAVLVDYRIYGGATDIVRFFDTARDTLFKSWGTYKVDIVWGGGDDLFERRLKQGGHLQGVRLSDEVVRRAYAQSEIAGLPLYDRADPPQWFGTALSSFGIIYNRDVLAHLGVSEPATWKDLRDPRYRNWIVLADPMRSAAAKTAFMIVVERAMQDAIDRGGSADAGWAQGMGLIRQIAANARLFADTGTAVPGAVSSGDFAAGMAIDFQARAQMDAVVAGGGSSRLGYIEPAGATAITPDPVAMVRGAEHPEIARHFIEFLLSERGQRLWNAPAGAPGGPKRTTLYRMPIMRSLYDTPANSSSTVNPYLASRDFNTSPARRATSSILAELVQMSCTDVLEDLRKTREMILASPRAAEIDREIGTFPFDQQEALRRSKQWWSATPLERLQLGRKWTDEFREEYRWLREAARGARS